MIASSGDVAVVPFGSPAVVSGKRYAVREDGVVFVAKVDQKFEVRAENNMGERVIATLVLLGNRILLRGEKNLYSVGAR